MIVKIPFYLGRISTRARAVILMTFILGALVMPAAIAQVT